MTTPAIFTELVAHIHDLALEALECGPDELHHLREIVNTAEDARHEADRLTNAIYQTEGADAGRACVRILKRQVQVDLSAIRSRYRFVCDPEREALRFEGRTWDLAAQGLASTDAGVRDAARKTLANLRGEPVVSGPHRIIHGAIVNTTGKPVTVTSPDAARKTLAELRGES